MNPITKLIIKRLLPTVKAGWIGPTKIPNLNAVSHSGAEAAGGITAATKAKLGL